MKRREFLNGLLMAGAMLAGSGLHLGAASRSSDGKRFPTLDHTDDFQRCHEIWNGTSFPSAEPEGPLHDCVIVGGGISGLTTAWKLRRRGVADLLLLEKDDATGGLCRAETISGIVSSRASAYSSFPFGEMIPLFKDLGIVTRVRESGKPVVDPRWLLKPPYDQAFVEGKSVSEPFFGPGVERLPVSRKVRDDLQAFGEKLASIQEWEDADGRTAFDTPLEESSPDPDKRGLDRMSLGEFVTGQGWSLEMARLFDPLLKSAYGAGHERLSAWAALDFLCDEILPADDDAGSLCFPGGNAFLTEKLAALLPADRVRSRCCVTRIVSGPKETVVEYLHEGKPRAVRARAVVFAAPQFMAPYLIADHPAARTAAVRTLTYAPYLVANLAVDRLGSGLAYSNQLIGDHVVSDFIVADWPVLKAPDKAPPERPTVLTAYCPLSHGDRGSLLAASFSTWENKILKDFERCLPGFSSTVRGMTLYRWGHALPIPAKGWLFSDERRTLRKPLGRIVFAGTDVEGIPTVDHAMAAGFRAAGEVYDALS